MVSYKETFPLYGTYEYVVQPVDAFSETSLHLLVYVTPKRY